jgi:hypothetical protein
VGSTSAFRPEMRYTWASLMAGFGHDNFSSVKPGVGGERRRSVAALRSRDDPHGRSLDELGTHPPRARRVRGRATRQWIGVEGGGSGAAPLTTKSRLADRIPRTGTMVIG